MSEIFNIIIDEIAKLSDEELEMVNQDCFLSGRGFFKDGKRIDPTDIYIEPEDKDKSKGD